MSRRTDWVVVHEATGPTMTIACLRCGVTMKITVDPPVSIKVLAATMKAFAADHRGCKERKHEPEAQ